MNSTVLATSSRVAASRVGLGAIEPALLALGVECVPVATCLLGRHPGWGAPGGGATPDAQFVDMLDGALAHARFAKAPPSHALSGYFTSPGQVRAFAERLASGTVLAVDPVMGDVGRGLYVSPDVAEALSRHLITRAKLAYPNLWEAARLSGLPVHSPQDAVAAARRIAPVCLVTSVEAGGRIGVVYVDADTALYAHTPRRAAAPNGAGDFFAAVHFGLHIAGQDPRDALARSVAASLAAIDASVAGELFGPSLAACAHAAATEVRLDPL